MKRGSRRVRGGEGGGHAERVGGGTEKWRRNVT